MQVPAVPPDDYKGTIADWIIKLKERGYLPPAADIGDHVSIEIPEEEWEEILEACEKRA